MLRRVISLGLLLLSLTVAGVPAIACTADQPLRDCCPGQQGSPCDNGESRGTDQSRLQARCAQALTVSAALSPTASAHDLQKHASQPERGAATVSFATSAKFRLASLRSFHPRGNVASLPAIAPLYLSTGRLRL